VIIGQILKSKGRSVMTARPHDSIHEIASRLSHRKIGAIVIVGDNGKVDGIISEVGSVVTDGAIEVTIAIADQAALGGLEVASVDVEFVSGRRYVYEGVPESVANTFRSAFARGVYFNSRIRDRFHYREAPHHEEATES